MDSTKKSTEGRSKGPDQSMPLSHRLARELKTITAMVNIYCRHHHGNGKATPCTGCAEFLAYAEKRLSRCAFGQQKPTCGRCPIHCYNKEMQVKARQIMRYSGPRMVWNHPVMALAHLLDGRKKIPELRDRGLADKKKET